MSEFFHVESGEWNRTGNGTAYAEVAHEPAKDQVKGGGNGHMSGAGDTAPSAESGSHGQLRRAEEPIGNDSKRTEQQAKPAMPKKANPFL